MTLVRWKPFERLSMMDGMNRLFEDRLCKEDDSRLHSLTSRYPTTDIYETEKDYVFRLEVPGLSKEDVSAELNNNTLSVKGEKKTDSTIKEESYQRIETYSGSFSRSFSLPKNVNASKINATMKDGILELRVAKAEIQKVKEIPINFN
ncbi:MAG: Hsp20/alpha crystallin family protein [bacterium]|nr:Hsp20/alpha crystallin family protein [bacterium]